MTSNSEAAWPRRPRPTTAHEFGIAIICALALEADAVLGLFDQHWNFNTLPFTKAQGDPNAYSTGAIGKHNVVLVHMPSMGKVHAATAAANCRASFPGVKLALVVGVCGVVPFKPGGEEIILGDVILGQALVQFDFGRQLPGRFTRKNTALDSLGGPDPEIRAALAKLKGIENRKQLQLAMVTHLGILQENEELAAEYPGSEHDILFEADYLHATDQLPCERLGCNGNRVARRRLQVGSPPPTVHFGLVASGDMIMKSGQDRDRIAQEEEVIAFEMEGAGVQINIPCIVVKGACDYADSHKNKIWQRYAAATAASCVKAFLRNWIPSSTPVLPPTSTQPSGPWFLLPYTRNRAFVGRNDILQKLQQKLQVSSFSQPRVALVGLGGIGKTQIALEYSCWLHNESPEVSVFWVRASSTERFRQSYFAIAQECNIPGHENTQDDILDVVKTWLERKHKSPWLMVIDNADDMHLFSLAQNDESGSSLSQTPSLTRYLPDCSQGSILITTRNKQVGLLLTKTQAVIKVDKMDNDESSKLVCSTLDFEVTPDKVSQLSSRLEHLPLAIVQAAAYIRMNNLTVERYLQLLDASDQNEMDLLSREFEAVGRDSGTIHAVASTWILSLKQIEKQNSLAIELLSLMSFFDRQAIPTAFLSDYNTRQSLSAQRGDIQFEDAQGILQAFSFITVQGGGNISMHRLVQLVTRKWLASKDLSSRFAREALLTVSALYPSWKFENRVICEAYLPHIYAVLQHKDSGSDEETKARRFLLFNAGEFLTYKGQWKDAEQCFLQVVGPLEQLEQTQNLQTLPSLSSLGGIYWEEGLWKKAEEIQLRVVEMCKRLLGEEDPGTCTSISNLALTYREQGRFAEAEKLQVHVMDIETRIYGKDDPATLVNMNNLALTYNEQGRKKEAELLKVRMLDTAKRILGPEHPDTLLGMANLASLYWEQGRLADAEVLIRQVLDIRLRILGRDHPSTIYSLNGLASIYWDQGKRQEALKMQDEVFDLSKRILGEDHPDTLSNMTNLGYYWERTGRKDDALALYERCLVLKEQTLGRDHRDTVTMRNYLVDVKRLPRG